MNSEADGLDVSLALIFYSPKTGDNSMNLMNHKLLLSFFLKLLNPLKIYCMILLYQNETFYIVVFNASGTEVVIYFLFLLSMII